MVGCAYQLFPPAGVQKSALDSSISVDLTDATDRRDCAYPAQPHMEFAHACTANDATHGATADPTN